MIVESFVMVFMICNIDRMYCEPDERIPFNTYEMCASSLESMKTRVFEDNDRQRTLHVFCAPHKFEVKE